MLVIYNQLIYKQEKKLIYEKVFSHQSPLKEE